MVGALDELVVMAGDAVDEDPQLDQLVAEVQDIRRAEPATNVIVYTEYVDSQRAAARALMRAGVGEVLTLSGEDDDASRGKITRRFCAADGIVLVSTDTAAEGAALEPPRGGPVDQRGRGADTCRPAQRRTVPGRRSQRLPPLRSLRPDAQCAPAGADHERRPAAPTRQHWRP